MESFPVGRGIISTSHERFAVYRSCLYGNLYYSCLFIMVASPPSRISFSFFLIFTILIHSARLYSRRGLAKFIYIIVCHVLLGSYWSRQQKNRRIYKTKKKKWSERRRRRREWLFPSDSTNRFRFCCCWLVVGRPSSSWCLSFPLGFLYLFSLSPKIRPDLQFTSDCLWKPRPTSLKHLHRGSCPCKTNVSDGSPASFQLWIDLFFLTDSKAI